MPGRTIARSAAVATAVLLAATLSGCGLFGSDGGSTPTTTRRTTTTSSTTTTTEPRADSPTLTNPGAEPRQALRLALVAGTTTTVTITTDLAVTQDDGATTRSFDPPPVTETVQYRVLDADADGSHLTVRVTAAEVAAAGTDLTPTEVVQLTAALKPIVGITGRAHIDLQGALSDVSFRVPKSVSADVRSQIDQLAGRLGSLAPRLPTEPVGVGATWTTADSTTLSGIEVEQRTQATVTGIQAKAVTYRTTTTITGGRQPVPDSVLGGLEGTTAELVSSSYEGTASGTLRLDLPVSAAESTVAGTQHLSVTASGAAPQDVDQRVRVVTKVRPRP
jgi:hypothetical protein